jgi:putative MATE family efflux protein
MVLTNSMGTINTLALSRYSDNSVASVGAAAQLLLMIFTFYGVVSAGASIVISQNLGAGKIKTAVDASIISIFFSASMSILLGGILSLNARPILTLMNLKDHLLEDAVTYFRICVSFSFFQAIFTSLSSVFRSYGKPRTAVKISLLMSFTNAVLNSIIVFRPFPFPLQGVWGIAISSVLSQAMGMCLLLYFFKKASFGIHLEKGTLKHLSLVGKIFSIGIPGGISNLSYSLSQVISTSIVATLGATAVSTKIYLDNIFFYVGVLGLALGQATSIMISRLSGAHMFEQAFKLNRQNLKITIFCNVTLSFLIFIFGKHLIGIFTDNPEIIKIARTIMIIDLFVEIGRGFNHIENNSLRGSGDVFYPMLISITSCWIMSISFSYILGIKLGFGLMGCWIAFAMDELFRGMLFYRRWRSGKWKGKVLI